MKAKTWTTYGTLTGAVLGLFLGWVYGPAMSNVAWLGELFLNALKFIVLPLVITAVIVGISGMGDVRKLGRQGGITIGYFVVTTCLSVLIGLILVLLIQPGVGFGTADASIPERLMMKSDFTFRDFILRFIGGEREPGKFNANLFYSLTKMEMLPLIIFSMIFAAVLTTIGDGGKQVIKVIRGVYDAIMKIVGGVIYFAPIGVFGLVAGKVGQLGGGEAVLAELQKVGMYTITVVLGLFIHGFIVLPCILKFIGGRSPIKYARGLFEALLTAFSTASSAATLPVTTRNIIHNNKVSEKSATFVLPIGATINMDGTALYEGVAVIFIAQVLGIDLGLTQLLTVFVLSALAAMAAAAIPEAGLVTMVLILQALNLPVEAIGLLLAVDWFLDRCRTTVNVWGDTIGSAVLDHYQKHHGSVKLEAL